MLVGKPPFQTKDVKAIYKRIKMLEYSFPPNVAISEEAVDLIQCILDREPQNRLVTSEILGHDFQYCGPFPRSIPSSAAHSAPNFDHLTAGQSSRNYLLVQKTSGASLTAPPIMSDLAHTAIPEAGKDASESESMHPPEPPAQVVAVSNGAAIAAQEMAMDREVKKVLDPGSPISELLKSARKPLMVSPRAQAAQREREKNDLARRAVGGNAAMHRGERMQQTDKENSPLRADARRTLRSHDRRAATKDKDGETGLEDAVKAMRVGSSAAAAASPKRVLQSISNGSIPQRVSAPTSALPSPRPTRPAVHIAYDIYSPIHATLDTTIGPSRARHPSTLKGMLSCRRCRYPLS